jgi:hypothetical protein
MENFPGVDVMITNFCDFFCQFSAKKLAFFLKIQCYDHFFAKTSSRYVVSEKHAKFFGENIFKIITSVPETNADLQTPEKSKTLF